MSSGSVSPRAAPAQRVLVLTSEDLAEANEVPAPIRPLLDTAEEIYVLAPTLTSWLQWLATDIDGARAAADERLQRVFDHMYSDGLTPRGRVASEDQVVAIADALRAFDADLIVLRLHLPGSERENWHEHRVAEQVRSHFDVPVVAFYFDSGGNVVGREEA
jgi:nucleotide-binding universal stress UspA family protein